MPGPVVAKSWIRLQNDIIAPIGEDTEILRWPVILDSGPRLVRLCVSGAFIAYGGGVSVNQLNALTMVKTLGYVKPVPTAFNIINQESIKSKGLVKFTGVNPGMVFSPPDTFIRTDDLTGTFIYSPTDTFYENNGEILADLKCKTIGSGGNCPAGQQFTGGFPQVFGICEQGMNNGEDVPEFSPYSISNSIEFIASIQGGQREFIIWISPVTDMVNKYITLAGISGVGSDYAWQATVEDLGTST